MRPLLDGAFSPTTDRGGFVEASAEEIAAWYVRWRWWALQEEHKVRSITGSLSEALTGLLPLQTYGNRTIFIPTDSVWTATFDDYWWGSDPAFVRLAASFLGCRALEFSNIADTIKEDGTGRYGAAVLRYYEPEAGQPLARTARSINAIHDGDRWDWDVQGEPFPFEDNDLYRKRRIRDRFPPEALRAYFEHLGIRAFDDDFYRPERGAIVVERRSSEGDEELSLEEARERLSFRSD
jgi:hypothetical protein